VLAPGFYTSSSHGKIQGKCHESCLGIQANKDTFILQSDVYNLAKKRDQESYESTRLTISMSVCGQKRTLMLFFFS
jgi:hypothetical protein